MTKKITPLIICGGNGTRLWPLSRRQAPKQFQRVGGPDSPTFFQSAVRRHQGAIYTDPVIVTGAMHEGTVRAQLRDIGASARIICEPMGRNTGPAVLAACEAASETDPDAIFVVIPADHVIDGDMAPAIAACGPAAADGRIITFGIPPRYAESGFGYIIDAGPLGASGSPLRQVGQFVEKPPIDEAERLIEAGGAFWASGLSMFSARTLISEYTRLDPESAAHVRTAVQSGTRTDNTLHLAGASFTMAASEPTEGLVFEHSDRIALAPLDVKWDDVGSWKAMHSVANPDANGNVFQGDVIALDTTNTLVRADSRLVSIVGLSNIVVVETADALLVAHMDESQKIKDIVERLKDAKRSEAVRHAEARPPKMVDMPEGAPIRLSAPVAEKAPGFQLGTSEIAVGQTSTMEQGPATQQAIVVRGHIRATGPGWTKEVHAGGRVYADDMGTLQLMNLGAEAAELLFVTLQDAPALPAEVVHQDARPAAIITELPRAVNG
ncbi:mannose-1-phosphate guanylyltransferase [Jannaschia sp. M317]|uniref:mannose-1-phosphate guanylyltransferase n=1 Tax=Jannaschia sp. M317 TaxID=2867011 RepID=UPI0021A2D36D|nr:sugar phosphate nucleotidyltransferase [Jannaschia sp. M317]UWQ19666.1 NTP transferase domain-containing protein [Jannaschia sp. M317]